MKKKIVLIVLSSLFLSLIAIALVLIFRPFDDNKGLEELRNDLTQATPPTVLVTPTKTNLQNLPVSSTVQATPAQSWKTFNYDFAGFEPKFSINYPADWEVLIDYESSGGNDVRLFKDNRRIEFDATIAGIPPHDHQEILQAFVTNFGSHEFNYTVTLIESGNLITGHFTKNPPYSIYRLTNNTDNSVSHAIIVDPYQLDGYLGSLFIWDRSGQDLQLIKEMLGSLKVIP